MRVGREAPVGPPSLPARSEATDDDVDDADDEAKGKNTCLIKI